MVSSIGQGWSRRTYEEVILVLETFWGLIKMSMTNLITSVTALTCFFQLPTRQFKYTDQLGELDIRLSLSFRNTACHVLDLSGSKSCGCSSMLGPAEAWSNGTLELGNGGSGGRKLPFAGLRSHDLSIDPQLTLWQTEVNRSKILTAGEYGLDVKVSENICKDVEHIGGLRVLALAANGSMRDYR